MPTPSDQDSLLSRRDALLQELAAIGDFRPGALVSQYRKCGKPTCHCARPDSSGHGPYWLITHRTGGKTRSQAVPAVALERAKEQLEEYRRLRGLWRELIEVSERLCEARLVEDKDSAPEKKRRSGRRSPRRLRPRSNG
jgi:hypothetical protein